MQCGERALGHLAESGPYLSTLRFSPEARPGGHRGPPYGAIEAAGRRRQEQAGEVEGETERLKKAVNELGLLSIALREVADKA